MATRPKRGSRNGIEWRTANDGRVSYRAVLNTKATGKWNGPWRTAQAEAKADRVKAQGEAAAGVRRKSSGETLRDAWETFYAGAKAGTIPDRTRKPYAESTLRGYERCWRLRVDAEFGAHKLDAIRHEDLQAFVDRMSAAGLSGGTIDNTIDPLRSIYRRALKRGTVAVNPTLDLDIPKSVGEPMRFASREEVAALLAALPDGERAFWATAFYGGLRRGELRALKWSSVKFSDAQHGPHIHVTQSWDDVGGDKAPKSASGVRRVPIVPMLAAALKAHKLATGRDGSDFVFGRTATEPFTSSTVRSRALRAWKRANEERAEELGRKLRDDERLEPITAHQCRHTCASMLIAAGCNAKALSVVLGHADIAITFNRYGHMMPGGEAEVGRLLGAYLASAPVAADAEVVAL
ncbi:tyrosine-type recombinase/integrase [Paraconexibacter algicola]|uniref:Site-specific integrase n=1 Tax=Paraconexibacter algicola TaxID=2133960 RepID=A0A2T4UDF6_9ACTN|nr:site-specific integrase [Paraconexibacter algicola]PTL55515.1 hypothetical protein C7Y72_17860 [Paraconexibacter algicola]